MRPRATASAKITLRTIADAYVVPARALVKDPETGQALVFAPLAGGEYRRVAVCVALQSAGFVAVRRSYAVYRGRWPMAHTNFLPHAVSADSGDGAGTIDRSHGD